MRRLHVSNQLTNVTVTDTLTDPADQADIGTDQPDLGMDDNTSAVIQVSVTSTDSISLAGSGMVFDNSFGSGVTAAFKSAIIAAENFYQVHFTNSVTLSCRFDLSPLGSNFSGENSYNPVNVSYAAFKAALASHATTADARAAVVSLPLNDPSNGLGFYLAAGEARILGLAGASGGGVDDTIILNSSLAWTYGQDAIGVIEHEISEGCMGRFGGLGISSGLWGPLDLFRYSAPGRRDYTGGADGLPTYFSVNGQDLTLQFHNSISPAGVDDGFDLGDWNSTFRDAFGPSGPGAPGTVSAVDLQVLNVLGWTPVSAIASTNLSGSTTSATFDLQTLLATSSYGSTPIVGGTGILIGSPYNDSLIIGTNEGAYTFDGEAGDNTVFVDGVGRAAAVLGGSSNAGITVALTGTTISALETQQIQFIDGTVEYDPSSLGAQVMRLYQAALGRAPDAPGLAYWVNALGTGATLTSLADTFMNSPEFLANFSSAGQSTSAFVTQLYANVLHRTPDAPGFTAWDTAINDGSITRAAALIGFSDSQENLQDTASVMQNGLYVANEQAAQVARLYYGTLGRPPDLAGLQGWVDELQSGQMTLLQVANSFTNSAEFLAQYGALNNLGFVDLLYKNVLHRTADPGGEAQWTSALNSGSLTRSGVVLGFTESLEGVNKLAPVIENNGITFA